MAFGRVYDTRLVFVFRTTVVVKNRLTKKVGKHCKGLSNIHGTILDSAEKVYKKTIYCYIYHFLYLHLVYLRVVVIFGGLKGLLLVGSSGTVNEEVRLDG